MEWVLVVVVVVVLLLLLVVVALMEPSTARLIVVVPVEPCSQSSTIVFGVTGQDEELDEHDNGEKEDSSLATCWGVKR